MSLSAEKLSRRAGELASRAREIQARHIAETRRRTAIWTVLSQPALRLAEPPAAAVPVEAFVEPEGFEDAERRKKTKKKAKKARKKAEKKAAKKAAKAARNGR